MCTSSVKFRLLRDEMRYQGITQLKLCEMWNEVHPDREKYQGEISLCLCGKREFKLDFAYFVLDVLGMPYESFHLFFPKGGIG